MKWKAEIATDTTSQKALKKELEFLYLKKTVVVELIRSLEQYDRFQGPESKTNKVA